MTLVEFLAPLSKGTHQNRVLAVLYFRERYEERTGLTTDDVRQGLKAARASGWSKLNVADVLNKSGALVDTSTSKGRQRLWSLTDTGRAHVRKVLGLPEADVEIEHDVGTLERLIKTVGDRDVHDYLNEALKCLKVGALRACVVFVWTGAIRTIHTALMTKSASAVTAAVLTHDSKARDIKSLDDFAYVKESVALLAARDLGILDKNQKDILTEALNLRNHCGHTGKYQPGVKKVSAFVEDVTTILFK